MKIRPITDASKFHVGNEFGGLFLPAYENLIVKSLLNGLTWRGLTNFRKKKLIFRKKNEKK